VQDNTGPNTFPRANQAISVASTSGFSVGQTVGLFDTGNPEWMCTKITAVGSGTITVAEMHWPLMSGSTVAAGGLTCYGFSLDADNATSTNSTTDSDDPIPSGTTIRTVYPIISNSSGNAIQLFGDGLAGHVNGFSTHAYAQMGGTGGTSTVTVSGGAVTSCTATGGSGYIGVNDPPQLVIAGITATTAPVIYVSGINAGALASCAVATPGAGISGTPTVSVVPTNAYHIFPQARVFEVYNKTTGAVDGSAVQTTAISGTFTNGDAVEQPHYFASRTLGLNLAVTNHQGDGSHDNISFVTNGNFGTNDYEATFVNNNAATTYQNYPVANQSYVPGMGQYGTPYGIVEEGPHADGLAMLLPPYAANGNSEMAGLYIDCFDSFTNSKVCNSWNQTIPVLGVTNVNASQYANDVWGYNPVTQTWSATAGATNRNGASPACSYSFGPGGFSYSGTGCSTTGTGSLVMASSPTFTGNATTFANGAPAEQDVTIQPGAGAEQVGAYAWNSYTGMSEWKLKKDASNYLRLTDAVNSLDREVYYQNGNTNLNAGAGANAVVVNGTGGSGTGGMLVESGGASPAAVLTVTGSGNTTATGFVSGKFMLGAGTMGLATGAAAGTGPAIACAASHVCDGVSGTVTVTTGTSPATGTLATLSFPNTHTNMANCIVDVLQSGIGRVTTATWTESTTAVTLTANAALTASTAYTVKYWCGGN
jgi:hypothetical protein